MPSATKSDFFLGTWDALTDTFTSALDLNDQTTFTIQHGGLKLPQPDKTIVLAGNIRTAGSVVPRWQYKERHIQVQFSLRGASLSAMVASIRTLLGILEAPPFCIKLALPGSSQDSYADVVAVKHDIPNDPQQLLAKVLTGLHIDFTCATFLRGDRVTLQNLVVNPGFEAPSGPGVTVFDDTFANVNAYTVAAGSAPSVASNVMTVPASSQVTFGSPAWGAINRWQIRFQAQANQVVNFCLHFTDANNLLFVESNTAVGTLQLYQTVGGTANSLAQATGIAYTAGNWYWLQMTQFPSVTGNPADVQATLFNDSAGAIGSSVATVGPVPTFDGVTALVGPMAIQTASTSVAVGGAFTNVQTVSLFGPGGWTPMTADAGGVGATGICAAAWEGLGQPSLNNLNCYDAGPVASFGAARIDLPPAGTVSAAWSTYGGGAPVGSSAISVTEGDTLAASCKVKSSGLSANALLYLIANEWDAGGGFLRFAVLQQVTGEQASWTTLSGSWTTGANCSYVSLALRMDDTTVAGESASATIWFDNVQCWNETTTGQSSMPYCELRFPQSPAQLMVSGIIGDFKAPTHLSLGTYLTSWAPGDKLTYVVGRRQVVSAAARLVGQPFDSSYAPLSKAPVLSSSAYGGWYLALTGTGSAFFIAGMPFGFTPDDLYGTYHLFTLGYSSEVVGNLPNVLLEAQSYETNYQWFADASGTILAQWRGPQTAPITAQNTWTIMDAGQVAVPLFPQGALTDPANHYGQIFPFLNDTNTVVGATLREGWNVLIPVDADVLLAIANNPTNSPLTVSNSWEWVYADGLLVNRGGQNDTAAWRVSTESGPTPNPAAGSGGPGTSSSGTINVTPTADPYLLLDPNGKTGSNANQLGVNQLAGFIADDAGDVLPLFAELQYSPQYLYPR